MREHCNKNVGGGPYFYNNISHGNGVSYVPYFHCILMRHPRTLIFTPPVLVPSMKQLIERQLITVGEKKKTARKINSVDIKVL